ncbi:MAG: DoxX family protein [Candidatus Marinimicrobia bacterium]|nr:DoxX family protein [Candidatus Neomarinimicrobiota bacterium]
MKKSRDIIDIGLLILRVGIGIMFILHGYPKIIGGPEKWFGLGEKAMTVLNIGFGFTFFGFMAALSEFLGGLLLILGLATRYASGFLLFTMFVAATLHLASGDGIMHASHAIESGVVFLSLIFLGSGKFSLDHYICDKCCVTKK